MINKLISLVLLVFFLTTGFSYSEDQFLFPKKKPSVFKEVQRNIDTENWKNFGTIELRDNDNTLHATSYCYKEKDTQANIGTFNHIISTVTPPQ